MQNATLHNLTHPSEVSSFLKKFEDSSQFLISNLQQYGPKVADDPYSGNYKYIKSGSEVVAVFYVARGGNVYAQATSADYTEIILDALKNEPFSIKGFLGPWDILQPLYEMHKSQDSSFKPTYESKEILYRLSLIENVSLREHPHVRRLVEDDFDLWFPLRSAYLEELNLTNHLNKGLVKERFLRAVAQKIWWGYFDGTDLVSIAGLNSQSENVGQIGGVYTRPELRKRGLSKATMIHMLKDCRDLHGLSKSILFTGEADVAAQKLYESIAYERIGYFALILS